ncbi:MAG: MazG nucleotide pyrophosphohydrolase domain-containing protein [Candidatus Peregrinibacteria bacterium]
MAQTSKTFKDLENLAAKLRGPNGCPWDKKRTITKMLKHIDEEVEELRQAIKNKDTKNLREELGDVLFQIVMISQIAKEKKYFTLSDVVTDIYKKIYSRHTWVFGKDKAKTPKEALEMWKRNKLIEHCKLKIDN